MSQHIVIDYLNLVTFYRLISRHRGSDVTSLFRLKSQFCEKILIKLLGIFNIQFNFDLMSFGKLYVNPYQDMLIKTSQMADQLMRFHTLRINSKVDLCFENKLRSEIFNIIARSNSILEYAKKYSQVDQMYITINAKRLFLNQYYDLLPDNYLKKIVLFYSAFGKVNDEGYWIKTFYRSKIKLLAKTFFVSFNFSSKNEKIDSLFFSHDKKTIKGWLNGIRVGKFYKSNYQIVWPDGKVGMKSSGLNINQINFKDLYIYLKHLKNGFEIFFTLTSSVGLDIFFAMFRYWLSLFLIHSFYKQHSVKIVYSNYDSDLTQLALALASDNNKMVSFAAIWSLGNYPNKGVITLHKFADRFFIWGKWHYELLMASKDQSQGYVITGYIGDIDLDQMRGRAKKLRHEYKKKYNNIISLYDASMFHDFLYNAEIAKELLEVILKIAIQTDSLVILKSKFKTDLYNQLMDLYPNHLIFDLEKGSLIPALASDVTIGIENSTPTVLSALNNKQVLNFNPAGSVWEQWETKFAKDIPMLSALSDLADAVKNTLKMGDKVYINTNISEFIDGKSQLRMAQYMNDVSDKIEYGKIDALSYADNNYADRYGSDKIIINE